jgi:hypothetical protein
MPDEKTGTRVVQADCLRDLEATIFKRGGAEAEVMGVKRKTRLTTARARQW